MTYRSGRRVSKNLKKTKSKLAFWFLTRKKNWRNWKKNRNQVEAGGRGGKQLRK